MHYTDKTRFGFSHMKHRTEFELSDNLQTLYEVCKVCDYAITKINFIVPDKLEHFICKTKRDYRTECCTCTTALECRTKHNCCCGDILDNEIETKRIHDLELQARGIRNRDPELAEMICKQNKEN